MFFGTFWEHHTCFRNYHVLIISYLDAILCYSEETKKFEIRTNSKYWIYNNWSTTEYYYNLLDCNACREW